MSKQAMTVYTPPMSSKAAITIAEQKSGIATRAQLKAMQQEQIKAHFAQQALQDISTARMEHLAAGAEAIWDIKAKPGRPADLQDIIDQAVVSATLRIDAYLQKSSDLSAAQIIAIQGAATYLEPELEVKGIFRKRLRG